MALTEQCHHFCRAGNHEWAHRVPAHSELDPYFRPCPKHAPQDVVAELMADEESAVRVESPGEDVAVLGCLLREAEIALPPDEIPFEELALPEADT
jgi:hypothetical protein